MNLPSPVEAGSDAGPAFALLDDAAASAASPRSLLFTNLVREHRCTDPAALPDTWAAAHSDARRGLSLLVLADYEWGVGLAGVRSRWHGGPSGGALRVLAFKTLARLSSEEVAAWLRVAEGRETPACAGVLSLAPTVQAASYEQAIERVLEYIRSGDTYQVNFTYRLRGRAFGPPVALYRRLRQRQAVGFGALLRLPRGQEGDPCWVLSLSPELFLRHEGGRLTAKPMKGTAPRDTDPGRDAGLRDWLAQDVKNRAENLMIVDLLRNDLGRVARIGSVKVPSLFTVESFRTVHQMTSTVEAELRPGVGFHEVLRALFPCGSITGAPKLRTLQIVDELETTPRRLYTGAIGWVAAAPAADAAGCGSFCLSVAIRTLLLGPQDEGGTRSAELGIGGGIVIDSSPAGELEETAVKARFLTTLDPGFGLFETLRVPVSRAIPRLPLHLDRLARSALALGFRFERERVLDLLRREVAALVPGGCFRLRLDLTFDGTPTVALTPMAAGLPPETVRFVLANAPLPRDERALVQHKTTLRRVYDAAIREAERAGAHDMLFFNEHEQLTEGARSNVFVRLHGHWWTPPLACGLLPGVMRARLLQRAACVGERPITRAELAAAEAVVVCNSLRGAQRALLLEA